MLIDRGKIEANEGQWFEWEDGARVQLRPIPRRKVSEFRSKNTKRGYLKHQPVQEVDEEAYEADRTDYCIVNWDGIVEPGGAPIACARENKLWLMDNYAPFSYFVNTTLAAMTTDASVIEAEAKNSSNSPGGTGSPAE